MDLTSKVVFAAAGASSSATASCATSSRAILPCCVGHQHRLTQQPHKRRGAQHLSDQGGLAVLCNQ